MARIGRAVVPDFLHHIVSEARAGWMVFSQLGTDKNTSIYGLA
jgi:hypothetical protein